MAKKYDWKITLKKGLFAFVIAGIGGLIAWLTGLPTTPTIVAIVAVLTAFLNYWKVGINGR